MISLDVVFASQYQAALGMLEDALRACPDSLWDAAAPLDAASPAQPIRFWHIAYHALHYTRLYLSPSLEAFSPWAKARADYHFLGPRPFPPHTPPVITEAYDRPSLLEYADACRAQVASALPLTDFSAPSGFHWLPFGKAELQVYNIRHIQHHAGQLALRLGGAGIRTPWKIKG